MGNKLTPEQQNVLNLAKQTRNDNTNCDEIANVFREIFKIDCSQYFAQQLPGLYRNFAMNQAKGPRKEPTPEELEKNFSN